MIREEKTMTESGEKLERLQSEASFQDQRMTLALQGQEEFRDKFYFINRRANRLYDSLHDTLKGKRVVVVGCSDCGVTPLARLGIHVEGIDVSSVSIEKLNRAIREEGLSEFASARVMDAENLEYADRSVDAITCSGVLHHLNSKAALESWSRKLRSDGQVIMFEPLALHPLAALFRILTPGMRTPDEHPLRGRDFKLMRENFGKVERHDYGLFTPIAAGLAVIPGMQWLARGVLPLLEGMDAVTLKVLPFLRNFCWLTVVRLTDPKTPATAQARRAS
jgi:SAM-dependent methyltransferase